MTTPRCKFNPTFSRLLPASLAAIMSLSVLAQDVAPGEGELPVSRLQVPVSINALMVTLVDHSAHYIWDYASDTRFMGDTEWQAIEYYAIQLAAAAPLITLGGTGAADPAWVTDPAWTRWARDMMTAGEMAMDAARLHDEALLDQAGSLLIDSCEGCHEAFKPDAPTEGLEHDPYYDHLYHFMVAEPAADALR